MRMRKLNSVPFMAVYDNTVDAFKPELWANESLAILEENMVMAMLVHRDFSPIVANFGDTVHTRRPGQFKGKRKTNADQVTIQDATAVDVPVKLDQHVHVSFMIKDGEESKSFQDLVTTYMAPAMLAEARFLDQILLMRVYGFLMNQYGALGGLTAANSTDYITGVRNIMNINKAYVDSRNLVLGPNTETTMLNNSQFTDANRVGDDGTALRNASLGRKFGYDLFMDQNIASVLPGNTQITGTISNASGYPKGYAGSITVASYTGAVSVGQWIQIAGDATPYRVKAHTETLGNTTAITLDAPLRHAVVNGAVTTSPVPGAVNQSVSPTGYAAGYSKEITVDAFTVAPQVGQAVSFGLSETAPVYGIIDVNGIVGITLDRPLEQAIADNALVNLGPAGEFNFAFHRNAVALVTRPLALPRQGTGALSAVVNMNGLSMRATLSYQAKDQGTLVTLDMLCGTAILDTNLGAVLVA